MVLSLAYVAVYILLVGVASFIEKPVGREFAAVQLNVLIRAGSLVAAAVALIVVHDFAVPSSRSVLAGLGIGLITGVGSLVYCFALDYLSVSLVVTLANLYIVITTLLGMTVLGEPVTPLKLTGLTCMVAGVVVLGHTPTRYGVNPATPSVDKPPPVRAFVIMATYVVLIGVGAFLEKPALRGLDPTQLNGLMAIAMTAVAGIALAAKRSGLPRARRTVAGIGVGIMIGMPPCSTSSAYTDSPYRSRPQRLTHT